MKIYYQSWIGNDILNHHKSTVVEVKSKMEGIEVFDLSYFAEYLNVSRYHFKYKYKYYFREQLIECNQQ